ncbi:MAG: hypothetical protein KF760_05295 [Candidatus Eremiobacteraeota bacterium]|nr:hypothetical protein [Candidatus Eremiobacteraeota bacterium]MCW5867175.1 hypothetical protein [Candidatus Eremiobacteraeota bacterium]
MNYTQARRIDSLLTHPDQEIVECEMIFGGTLAMLHFLTPEGLNHPDRLRLIRLQQALPANDPQAWRDLAAQARAILTQLRSDYQQLLHQPS